MSAHDPPGAPTPPNTPSRHNTPIGSNPSWEPPQEPKSLSHQSESENNEDLASKEDSASSNDADSLNTNEDWPSRDHTDTAAESTKLSLYKATDSVAGLAKSGISKKKKYYLIGGFLGVLAPLAVILIILFIMSLLKIPNYATNIAAYRLARSAMEYSRTSAEIDATKVGMENAEKSAIDAFDSQTKGWLVKYRPKKVYSNMIATQRITYDSDKKIKSVFLDGKEINIKQRWGDLWGNYKARATFAGEIQANVDKALEGYSSLVRNKVAKQIRLNMGIKLSWWEKKGSTYKNAKASEADWLAEKERIKNIKTLPDDGQGALTKTVDEVIDDMKSEIDNCLSDKKCVDEMVNKKWPERLSSKLASLTTGGIFNSIVGVINPLFSIAIPFCLIYDGSIVRSGGDIDAQSASANKSFYALETAADQAKTGDTTTEAYGSFDRLLGKGDSIPDQYMRGNKPDTQLEKSPQASISGDFTIVNALLGGNNVTIANLIGDAANKVCPVLTDAKAMLLVGLLAAIPSLFSGVGEAGQGISAVLKKIVTNFLEKIIFGGITKLGEKSALQLFIAFSKNAWGFTKKFARDFAIIEGTTVLAKGIVLSKSGVINDGASVTATGADFKNQADMGGDLHNNELNRQAFYGAPMVNKDIAMNDKEVALYLDDQQKTLPTFDRYFARSNPRSLLSKASYQVAYLKNIGINQYIYKFISLAKLTTVLNSLFGFNRNGFALAADGSINGHYNVVQWGWTQEELNLIKSSKSYGVLENAQILKDKPEEVQKISEKYDPCFTESLGTLLSGGGDAGKVKLFREANGDLISDKGDCSPNQLGPHNPDFGDMVFRYRLGKKRDTMISELLGMQDPTEDTAAGTATVGDCTGLELGSPNAAGRYLLPFPKDSGYITDGPSDTAHRWGDKELIELIYQVGKKWQAVHPDKPFHVNDLDAPGHLSHKNGVDVDITGCPLMISCVGDYDKELSLELMKMFLEGGNIDLIIYEDPYVQDNGQKYANDNNLPGTIMNATQAGVEIGSHTTHFHVRIEKGKAPKGCE